MAAKIDQYLDIIRNANSGESVRDAIIKCMRDINAESAIRALNLLITKADNVTHTAPAGFAFKNVTVNIDGEGESDPDKTYVYKEFSVTNETENGEYPGSDEPNTAYNRVIVDIDWDGITGGIADEATMTYTTTDPTTGQKYWDVITDEGYTAAKRIWIGTGLNLGLPDYPGGPGTTPGSTTGPFVVTYLNETKRTIATVTGVPYGGSVYTTDPEINTKLEGQYAKTFNGQPFSNWIGGDPNYVTSNMTLRPNYTFQTSPGTIEKPWTEIMENKGADIGIGSTIRVVMNEPVDLAHMNVMSGATIDDSHNHLTALFASKSVSAGAINVEMMVVAHGEGGTTTTFLATEPLSYDFLNNRIYNWSNDVSFMPQGVGRPGGLMATNYGCDDVVSSYYYYILMYTIWRLLPSELRDNIKTCSSKIQYDLSSLSLSLTDIRRESGKSWTVVSQRGGTNTKVWLPSYGELYTLASDAIANERSTITYPDPNTFKPESATGYGTVKDYSLVWQPKTLSSDVVEISTRSTFIGIAGGLASPGCIGLRYSPDQSAQTIPEQITINRNNFGVGYDDKIYFGFCI